MTYVGATPTTGDFKKLDSITTSSATTFNLRQGSVAVYPQSANHCIVSLNGVIQAPIDAFTIVNDTIVFASSLASSDAIDFILVLGNVNDIGTVSDDTVSQAKIQSEAINEAKMQISNAGTNGQYLQKQSGNTGGLTWADAGLTGWSTGGTSNSLIPSATDQGIYLGVSSATAANLLDDYEEGEFANALSIDGTTQTNYSSGRSHLKYVKIGSLVHCSGLIDTDGQTLQDTGQIYVRLPFTVASSGSNSYNASKAFSNIMGGASTHPGYFYVQENDTICEFDLIDSSGSTAVDGGGLSVSSTSHRVFMFLDITYQTDA